MSIVPRLAIISPCFNEEAVLPETIKRMKEFLIRMIAQNKIAQNSYFLMVDDGSKDKTWSIIEENNKASDLIRGLKLSRNFGHQNALLAGLYHVEDADVTVSIDADLQNDILTIEEMLEEYQLGNEVVLAVRNDREVDSFMKKLTALGFYKLLSIMGVESVRNHADFRLMSKKALDAFKDFKEVNLYLRGMMPLIGFQQTTVNYECAERFAGTSKYNFRKMLSFAWSGVSSMSVKPLHFVTFCGFAIFFISICLSVYVVWIYFINEAVTGWASTLIPIYFLGGIQLLCIGLIGEYVAKIYSEVKQRPRYIVEKRLGK